MNEYAWKGIVFSNGLKLQTCFTEATWDLPFRWVLRLSTVERQHISFALWALFWGYTLIAFATRVTSHPSHNDKVCRLCSAGTIEARNYHPTSTHLNLCTTLHGAANLLTIWCILDTILVLSQFVNFQIGKTLYFPNVKV